MTETRPRPVPLSVVIATRDGWSALGPMLGPLLHQVEQVGGEVVVASGRPENTPPSTTPDCLRWTATHDTNLLRLRASAVRAARGEVIAIGEDHAVPAQGWCEAILRAHTEHPDAAAIVGCLRNATDRTVAGRANFLAFAAAFAAPMPNLPPNRPPPSSTLSFKREALRDLDERPGTLEAVLLPRLFEQGALIADDRIIVDHHQDHGVRWSVRNAYANTRSHYGYAGLRLDPAGRRAVARWVLRNVPIGLCHEAMAGRGRVPFRTRDLPVVALLAAASGIGGAVGSVAGPGRAPDRAA